MIDEVEYDDDEEGPEVLKSKILLAISEMKERKAAGVDDIPAEMLKRLGEKATQELCDVSKDMY